MKKYFLIAVAACLCLAMAAPALAEVKISGLLSTDIYWFSKDAAYNQGGVPQGTAVTYTDTTVFEINVYRPQNYIQAVYTNKDNTIGGRFRIRAGLNENGLAPANSEFDIQTSHMWWKFYPGAKVSIGSVPQIIGGAGAYLPHMGSNRSESGNIIVSIGYGNIHTSARSGIVLNWVFNKMVGLDVGLYDPANYNTGASTRGVTLGSSNPALATAPVEIKVPRIDIAVPIKYAGFKFNPKGSWITRKFDQVAVNTENSYDVWAMGIDVTWTYGPFSAAGDYVTGKNLADANYAGAIGGGVPFTSSGITKISDADEDHWFLSARYAFTKKLRIKASYGQGKSENEVNPSITGDNVDITRTAYGLGLDWFLAPNLICFPQVMWFDRGDDNLNGDGLGKTDNGSSAVYGLQFQLLF
jgi:hypothetical protein